MKILKVTLVVGNVCCMVGVIFLLLREPDSKSAFFLSADVYNEFEYKKELEFELESSHSSTKIILDSMETDLKTTIALMQGTTLSDDELILLQRKQNSYIDYRDVVESEYARKTEEYYALIWDRINGYIKEYGDENGYQYIFGANGDGSIMYANSSSDITTEITQYINNRYQGE